MQFKSKPRTDQKSQSKPTLTRLTLQKMKMRRTQKKMAITPVPMRITISTFVLLSDPNGGKHVWHGMRSFPAVCAILHDRTSFKTHCSSLIQTSVPALNTQEPASLNPVSVYEGTLYFVSILTEELMHLLTCVTRYKKKKRKKKDIRR